MGVSQKRKRTYAKGDAGECGGWDLSSFSGDAEADTFGGGGARPDKAS